MENSKREEKLKELLNQHMSRLYIPTMKSRKDMTKYIEMLKEKPSEKDYKNTEEKINEIGEAYYGGGMPESIISTDVKIWFINTYIKIESFLRRFKRSK